MSEFESRQQGERRVQNDPNYSGKERRAMADRRKENNKQYSTFYIADRLYGIEVKEVQEVTRSLPMTQVPLSPDYIYGLINLRGQIATAIGLRELFKIEGEKPEKQMNVVCRLDDLLISLSVDRIGDVLEIGDSFFEATPDTLPDSVKKFMNGVYKTSDTLLSVVDIQKILEAVNSEKEKKAS
ncbi:MAG: chemotaxis protein CheW [Phyllobacteriaceae bacterium]|nr:chemotaxis protein CheW [Phyllobacteriaceae bacterium]